MADANTTENTVPIELSRQSRRVTEQLEQLNRILDTITNRLGNMSSMMRSYSPELVRQFNSLKTYLETYKGKSNKIYSDISLSLSTYAYNLLHNLDNLTSSVDSIGNSVSDL